MITEQRYILALSFIRNLGDNRINFLIQNLGSAQNVWEFKKHDFSILGKIGNKIFSEIGKVEYLKLADQEIEFCLRNGIKMIDYFNPAYPKLLKECPDAPAMLFVKGNVDFETNTTIAIVGTRKMTKYGGLFIEEIIDGLKEFNVNIVSGLAYGCDIYAHKKALDCGLSTWAVMAHHLNHIYPPKHRNIAEEMLDNGGWISEQSSSKGIQPAYFLERNRIIAGLSKATILVESAEYGGSLVTAKYANDYNRDVFALPGRSNDPMSKGCNYLIKTNQAQLIENVSDLIYHLNLDHQPKTKQLELFYNLSDDEKEIVDYLKQNGKTHIDTLALELNKFSFELMPILLDLELNQIVFPHPGKYFDLSP